MTHGDKQTTLCRVNQKELTEKQQKKIAIISLVFAVVFMVSVAIFVGIPLVRLISEPERFRQWVARYGIWGKMAFIGMEVIKVVIAVIPGEPFELAAGYAFGTIIDLLNAEIEHYRQILARKGGGSGGGNNGGGGDDDGGDTPTPTPDPDNGGGSGDNGGGSNGGGNDVN